MFDVMRMLTRNFSYIGILIKRENLPIWIEVVSFKVLSHDII